MPSNAAAERQVLADAMAAAGPDAPTLCEGWTVRDLAAHLVVRERRPDTLPGLVVPGMGRWTEHVRRGQAKRDFATLVDDVRTGPPRTSLFALPKVDAMANLAEHFVHAEDVLRAQEGWTPRVLSPRLSDALWSLISSRGRVFFARSGVGVVIATPQGRREVVKSGSPSVTLTGEPGELVLYAFGRTSVAQVEITGDEDAVATFRETRLGV